MENAKYKSYLIDLISIIKKQAKEAKLEADHPILTSVLETIENVSNKEYQKRVWIQGKGPEVDDFDETCCNFFGDGDPLLESYKEFGLTEFQYLSLKKFRDKLREFSDKYDHSYAFIDTSEWNEITEMAKEVLKVFGYKKYTKTT